MSSLEPWTQWSNDGAQRRRAQGDLCRALFGIDLDIPVVAAALPRELALSAVMRAELTAGPVRAFGQIVAAVAATGRSHRRRAFDLMIAATAVAQGMDLVTRNPEDFIGLEEILVVHSV